MPDLHAGGYLSPYELDLPESLAPKAAALGSGREALESLSHATALQWTLEILSGAEFARTHLPSSVAQLLFTLVETLSESPQGVDRWMADPEFRAWMHRMRTLLVGAQAGSATEAEVVAQTHLLPLLFAGEPSWDAYAPRESIEVRLPPRGVAPVGGLDRLRPARGSSAPLELHWAHGGLSLHEGSRVLASAKRVDGALSWDCGDSSMLRAEPRVFIVGGAVEVLAAADHGELADLRAPEEQPTDLTPDELDNELSRALAVLGWAWPEAMIDIGGYFHGLLAMQMPEERWNSASTRELPLVLQLTIRRRGNPYLLAESIVHETSHVLLDQLMFPGELLHDDGHKRYRHPWRPDLRPITGVLLGAHAFLSVALFYRRCLSVRPDDPFLARELETRLREVGEALDLLERHAAFSDIGRRLFEQMRRLHADSR